MQRHPTAPENMVIRDMSTERTHMFLGLRRVPALCLRFFVVALRCFFLRPAVIS